MKAPRFDGSEVIFSEEDARRVHFPHNNALVVDAMLGNHTVYRILVDNGSLVDILSSDCLEKMGIPKEQMEKNTKPLYEVTGDSVIPQRTNRLPVTAVEKPRHAIVMVDFVVIKGAS